MATVNKNFVIKNGLVVQGSTATINGNDILTKNSGDAYILNLVGGATLVKSVDSVFTVDNSGNLTLNYGTGLTKSNGNLVINRSTVDTWYDAHGSASQALSDANSYTDQQISTLQGSTNTDIQNAIAAAESYADTAATNAENAANAYTDSAISTEVTNRNSAINTAKNQAQSYADTAAQNAQSAAESYTDNAISTEVTNRNNAINTAKNQAETYADTAATNAENAAKSYADSLSVNYDSAGTAATAQANAEDYADAAVTAHNNQTTNVHGIANTANLATKSYADNAASTAQTNAENYADSAATAAENAAKSYADGLASNYDPAGSALTAENNAKNYADAAVAGVVNGAPALLDTLKELADAIGNDPSISTTLGNAIGGKVAKTGDTMSGNLAMGGNKVTGLGSPTGSADAAPKQYVDDAQSAAESYADSAATSAENTAKNYADSLASNYDSAGSAANAQSNAEAYADNLVAAGNSNAEPTYKGVKIGSYTELVSGWADTVTGSPFIPLVWNSNTWGTAKLVVHVRSGAHTQASEVLIARDSSNNLHITEYAAITTNGALADISVTAAGSTISLVVTPTAGHNATEAVASGQIMVWAD